MKFDMPLDKETESFLSFFNYLDFLFFSELFINLKRKRLCFIYGELILFILIFEQFSFRLLLFLSVLSIKLNCIHLGGLSSEALSKVEHRFILITLSISGRTSWDSINVSDLWEKYCRLIGILETILVFAN